MSVTDRTAGTALLAIGAGLVANPLYLDVLTIYPDGGWQFLPLFHAAFTALGALAALAGGHRLVPAGASPIATPIQWAVLTTLSVPLWGVALRAVADSTDAAVLGYGARTTFVAALVAGAFLLGVAIRDRCRRTGVVVIVLPLVALGPVVVEWTDAALLGPVLDGYFLLTGTPILGLPYVGALTLLGAVALGWGARPAPADEAPSARLGGSDP